MTTNINPFGQPIGRPVADWQPRPAPQRIILTGNYCHLVPLTAERHAEDLYQAFHPRDNADSLWTYLTSGPFNDRQAFTDWLHAAELSRDPLHFSVIDNHSGKATGTLSLMRIDTTNGVIEAGHVIFSPLLQRSAMSTEAQFLLMKYVFDTLGYRRYEWKCDSLNVPSRRAALRLGFSFEGIFRQALIYKGRNRDTAWYSITDEEWSGLSASFSGWLAADNFDPQGRQRNSLSHFRSAAV